MSSIFQGLLDASGRLNSGVGPIAFFFRSLPLNAAGQIVIGSGPIVRFEQGIPRNAAREVVGISAAQPSEYGPGALPYGPNNEIVGAGVVPPIAFYHQGVPYDAEGRYCGTSVPVDEVVAANLTLTPAVISSTSAGFRAAPAAGTLVPATLFGGTVILLQAIDDGTVYVQNTGGVEFTGISGNVTMQLGPYIGSNRVILTWDNIDRYVAEEPGLYAYLTQQIGVATTVRFSGAPSGTAGIEKAFNMTVGQDAQPDNFGYWPAAGMNGPLAPDTAFAGGTIARLTGAWNGIDNIIIGQPSGQPFPDIGFGEIILSIAGAEGFGSPWTIPWNGSFGGYGKTSESGLAYYLSNYVGQVRALVLRGVPV
jgi:hypothetical protein